MPQEIDSGRMGKAVEHLVAASWILASGGKLNVSTALVDDEGVDAVFHRRDHSATLAVQIKARSVAAATMTKYGRFLAFVRSETFRPRPNLYVLFIVVDVWGGTYELAWLVPSKILADRAGRDRRGRLRFNASPKPNTHDQWREFRVTRAELPLRILEVLEELES